MPNARLVFAAAMLVAALLAGCARKRLPADCKAHQAAVCEECGPDSYACEDIAATMRFGLRKGATAAQCKEGLDKHPRNVVAAGGVEAWCRMANDKQNFNNARR